MIRCDTSSSAVDALARRRQAAAKTSRYQFIIADYRGPYGLASPWLRAGARTSGWAIRGLMLSSIGTGVTVRGWKARIGRLAW